jgi:hypothetical protein
MEIVSFEKLQVHRPTPLQLDLTLWKFLILMFDQYGHWQSGTRCVQFTGTLTVGCEWSDHPESYASGKIATVIGSSVPDRSKVMTQTKGIPSSSTLEVRHGATNPT